jgi:hypothetical protein
VVTTGETLVDPLTPDPLNPFGVQLVAFVEDQESADD